MSEKSVKKIEDSNEYTFVVDCGLSKHQIEKLVKDTFGVHPLSISTQIKKAKARKVGKSKRIIYSPRLKYAVVRLGSKEKIDLFEIKEGKRGKK